MYKNIFLHNMNNHTQTHTPYLSNNLKKKYLLGLTNTTIILLLTDFPTNDYQNGCQKLAFRLLFSLLLLLLLSKPLLTYVSDGKLTSPAGYLINVPHFIHQLSLDGYQVGVLEPSTLDVCLDLECMCVCREGQREERGAEYRWLSRAIINYYEIHSTYLASFIAEKLN